MSLQSIATAEAYAAAIYQLTGTPATVVHKKDYSEVSFSNPRATQEWIENQLKPGDPGDVRLNFLPVVTPVILKRVVPAALAVLAVGYLIGKIR
jgi:hypothetical protein